MTRIAIGAVVHVTRYLPVPGIRFCPPMTTDKTGKNRIIGGIGMAIAAGRPLVPVDSAVYRESIMCNIRTGPPGCRVAFGTALRKSGSDMRGIGGGVVVRRMARIAIRGKTDILPVAVTVPALQCRMGSRKRELGSAVIEEGVSP
jgi:hypothetical protein